MNLLRPIAYSVIIVFAALFCCVLVGEAVFRIAVKTPPPPYNNKQIDIALGWKPMEGYRFHTEKFPDNKAGFYPVDLSFQKNGFRRWPGLSNDSLLKTILVIGDSYVESLQCSDTNTFYALLSSSLPASVFAFGCSGYGTLQELMVIDRYIDSIRPHYVLLEMCNNDFADNYWELEKACSYKVGRRRPYLTVDSTIEYHHPHYFIEDVKQYSLFLNFILVKAKNALIKLHVINSATKGDLLVQQHKLNYQPYNTAYRVTGMLLERVKKIAAQHNSQLLVFNADNFEPSATQLRDLCRVYNVKMIEGVADSVYAKELQGVTVRAYDGYHWNNTGHKIVGEVLLQYFEGLDKD